MSKKMCILQKTNQIVSGKTILDSNSIPSKREKIMTRFKTRRSWTIVVPAFVLLVGVLVLGVRADSSPASDIPTVPEGTARVIPSSTPANPAPSTVSMDQWRYTSGPVQGTNYTF